MKNLIRSAVFMLSTGMLFAQTQGAQTNVGQPTDANQPVHKGCLSGTKNNYILTKADGSKFRLHSDKDLDDHINRTVELRGNVKAEGADRSPSATRQFPEIDVADLKTISQGCDPNVSANPSQTGTNNVPAATAAGNTGMTATAGTAQTGGSATMGATTTVAPSTMTTVAAGTTPCNPNASAAVGSTTNTTTAPTGTTVAANANTMPQSDQTPQTDAGGATDKDEPLFKGCITGSKGQFMLKTDDGMQYRLHSDKDINEHTGNRVEIRGTIQPEGVSKEKAANNWKGELDVADIKTVSKGCAMGQHKH